MTRNEIDQKLAEICERHGYDYLIRSGSVSALPSKGRALIEVDEGVFFRAPSFLAPDDSQGKLQLILSVLTAGEIAKNCG